MSMSIAAAHRSWRVKMAGRSPAGAPRKVEKRLAQARTLICRVAVAAAFLGAGLGAGGALGQGEVHVPEDLRDWQGWVLHGQEHRACPFLHDAAAIGQEQFICAWPGLLAIRADAQGGSFEQRWTIYGAEQWVPLPGDGQVWPQNATVDERAATLALRQGTPSIRLGPGSHRVAGAFAWSERPAALTVPSRTGLVALWMDGDRVALPRRSANGIWLGEGERAAKVQDALKVQVFRRILDDVPTRLESEFALDISGSVREELLAPALPDAFTPLALESRLPARLEPDGSLRLQARPGSWRIRLKARAAGALNELTLPAPVRNLPNAEIWSYQANPRLRATTPEAARAIDPTLVGAPWPDLPTFRMAAEESLRILERSRGQAEAGNRLELHRQLWLDFDGGGFAFADELSGRLRTDWRLDMASPYALLSAREWGRNLLVTSNGEAAGVELRRADLSLDALGRIETRGEMPAAGWRSDLSSMTATLNLPPGYKLLAALGVDEAPASWAGRWRLLDFFLLLVITLGVARLFGRRAAAVALLALLLSFHEQSAPVWSWLNLLAAVALARAAPPGRLQHAARSYRLASFALLLILLLPFAAEQIRIAVHPQLEPETLRLGQTSAWTDGLFGGTSAPASPESERAADQDLEAAQAGAEIAQTRASEGSRRTAAPNGLAPPKKLAGIHTQTLRLEASRGAALEFDRYGAGDLVQTGPGRPDWEWTPYALHWGGPVKADRSMRLVILPDGLVSVLRFAAVAALGLLAALFAFDLLGRRWRWPKFGSAAALAALALLTAPTQGLRAATPAPEILEELEQRLLAPPPCVPRCAELVAARALIGASDLTLLLEIHALAQVAVPIPGAEQGWKPTRIVLGEAAGEAASGAAALPAHRGEDALLRVRLKSGRHVLELHGPLPPGDALEVAFPMPPRSIAAQSEHWFVTGIENGSLPSGALGLTRLERGDRDQQASRPWEAIRFPPFLQVERTVQLGLDWRIDTQVRRLAPAIGAISIDIPLLEGESVLEGDRKVRAGRILVAMDPDQQRFRWSSSLPRRSSMKLQAPTDQPWQEIWSFVIGSAWKAEFRGVPESEPGPEATVRVALFHPRPGEVLEAAFVRPEGISGSALAFDKVRLETVIGADLRSAQLTLGYRSTRGASQPIRLPAAAQLRMATIDGAPQPLKLLPAAPGEADAPAGKTLILPIAPGAHQVVLAWDEPAALGLRVHPPAVGLGAPASNIVTRLEMPASRWLLFTKGPSLGPAVLYWSELIALLAASLILGRIAPTPLGFRHWLLLGLGFSTFSWFAFAVVALWLLAHGARQSRGGSWPPAIYNLSQIGFALLSLAALAALLTGIPQGLLGNPDMSLTGFESQGRTLTWFADQTADALPDAAVWSLPIPIYKALILAWALWLTFALIRWLPWVWRRFSEPGLWLDSSAA